MPSYSRAGLLSRGAAFLAGAGAIAAFPGSAAADPLPDADLAFARLLVAAELLTADFYGQAAASKQFAGARLAFLQRALFNEQEHYTAVAQILSGAGQTPATAADIDFTYPRDAFASRASIARLGVEVETISLGAYLGAVGGFQSAALKQPAARIAASESEHLSVLSREAGLRPIGVSFPAPLTVEQASDALDAYTS